MSEKIDLLPCPFCGGEAEYQHWTDNGVTMCRAVVCQGDCESIQQYGSNEESAIKAWNTRHDDKLRALEEQNKRLRDAVETIGQESDMDQEQIIELEAEVERLRSVLERISDNNQVRIIEYAQELASEALKVKK